MKLFLSLIATLCALQCGAASIYYVSTTGSSTNSGSISSPWTLQHAVTNATVTSGDTIYLRGGTYGTGSTYAVLATVPGITVRQYPYERAIINGAMYANASNQIHQGYEIYNSAASTRTNASSVLGPGLYLASPGCKAVNMVIHDTGNAGIWWPEAATTSEIYGCLLWGVGLYDTEDGNNVRGTAIYGQNQTGTRTVQDNISFKNFSGGMKAYAESVYANGFAFDGNVTFWNYADGILIDTLNNPITSAIVTTNLSYNDNVNRIGMSAIGHTNLVFVGNTTIGTAPGNYTMLTWSKGFRNIIWTNNLYVENSASTDYADTVKMWQIERYVGGTYDVNRNTYWTTGLDSQVFDVDDGPRQRFAQIQASPGWELNGTFNQTAVPTTSVITVRPNKYETGRANISVLNWEGTTSASVSLASVGLVDGQPYQIRDVQNWLGTPIATGTYSASSPTITLSLTSTNVTAILGTETHMLRDPNSHTPSLFNVFVVEPTADAVTSRIKIRGAKIRGAKL